MKKSKVKNTLILLLTLLSCLMASSGCSTDDRPLLTLIERAQLSKIIAEAEVLLATTSEGSEIGQFEAGSQSILRSASANALNLLNEERTTRGQLDNEAERLAKAIDTYRQGAHFLYIDRWELLSQVSESNIRNLVNKEETDLSAIISGKELSKVRVFKLTYHTTDVQGNEILASGVIMYGKDISEISLLSFQHGSLYTQADAPSAYNRERLLTIYGVAVASTGYAVIMPDYLGYGVSSDYPHPDEHGKTLASASFDMLRASKEFLAANQVALNENLFITGYSEGGYATMALHKHIEDNSELKITMSAPASGSYNKSAFYQEMMSLDQDFDYPGSPMWVIDSYNWIYELNRSWSDYINEPHASIMEQTPHPFHFINADLAKNPQDLYTESFRNGLINGTDTEYLSVIADNDYFDWFPKAPITLYYGTADEWVFPINATSAYEALSANGADINLIGYEGKDHFTAAEPYLLDVYQLFESLK